MKKQILIGVLVTALLAAGIIAYNNFFVSEKIPALLPRANDSNVSAEYLNAQRTVEYYREQIRKNPDDPRNYVELAQVFLQEARVTGRDHEYVLNAMELVDRALELDKTNLDAKLTKANIFLTRHKFEDAKKIGEWAAGKYPYSSSVYAILTDAYVELGEYEKAVKVCDKLLSIKPDLRSYSRASYIRELHGQRESAIDAMRLAADAGVTGQENRAWVLYNLGNLYMQTGKIDTAAFIFNGILQERPSYAFAHAGLSKVMTAKKNYSLALKHLLKAFQLMPEHLFIEQKADLYLAMGNKEAEKKLINEVIVALKEDEGQGWNVDLEYARFCLNHNINIKEAFVRAEREYKRRGNNVEVKTIYAWALYKMNNLNRAAKIIDEVLKFDSRNPLARYYTGVIYSALGKNDFAVRHLEKSLTKGFACNPVFYADAQQRIGTLRNKLVASR
ncbi:MAG: tetratricopeptide repeat protein [Ignavibacteriales bacterium]|nr:tetratricopeptide repeat protein [Ignavibacteriales bacterium]